MNLRSQVDLENLELIDLDQLDMDEKGPICPSARGLGADLKQQWYSSVDEEVRRKLREREEAMKLEIQVSTYTPIPQHFGQAWPLSQLLLGPVHSIAPAGHPSTSPPRAALQNLIIRAAAISDQCSPCHQLY